MSAAACAGLISRPSSPSCSRNLDKRVLTFHNCRAHLFFGIPANPSPNGLFLRRMKRRNSLSSSRTKPVRPAPTRHFSPVMEWQDCSAEIEVDVPCSVAYDCYSDREAIPLWMPFISSVKVLEDKPDLSRWTLKYEVFGRDVEFAWLARNLQPIRNQKIHWRSLEGLPNRGAVRFYPKGQSSCKIELTVSYEIPQILVPVGTALKPFLEGLLLQGLERFAEVAKGYQSRIS